MKTSESRLTGSGGVDLYYAEWIADAPRALVFVVHGLADHIGRHNQLINRLVENGYAVAAIDLRGHGKSGGTRCFVDAFDMYVSDVTLALVRAARPYNKIPTVLFGHSMGALVAALYEVMVKPNLAGLILSSGAFSLPDSEILQKLSGIIGSLAPRLPTVRLDTSLLSRDADVARSANADPLYYTGRLPARTGAEIVAASQLLTEHASDIVAPLLIFHGTKDGITRPEGSEQIYDMASAVDKTLHLFNGLYHETFNEPEKDEVFDLIFAWLDERF